MKSTFFQFPVTVLVAAGLLQGCTKTPPPETTPSTPSPTAAVSAAAASVAEPMVKHVDAKGAAVLLSENKEVVVLDVRTPEEYAAGHISGARNIDFRGASFADNLGGLDKSKTYMVHCASGRRSTESLAVFQKLGFKAIVHMDGGFNGWVAAELPVEK